eukprot:SAG11_NODE_1967_length_3986_cov_19.956522_3_plen_102_part_00
MLVLLLGCMVAVTALVLVSVRKCLGAPWASISAGALAPEIYLKTIMQLDLLGTWYSVTWYSVHPRSAADSNGLPGTRYYYPRILNLVLLILNLSSTGYLGS